MVCYLLSIFLYKSLLISKCRKWFTCADQQQSKNKEKSSNKGMHFLQVHNRSACQKNVGLMDFHILKINIFKVNRLCSDPRCVIRKTALQKVQVAIIKSHFLLSGSTRNRQQFIEDYVISLQTNPLIIQSLSTKKGEYIEFALIFLKNGNSKRPP